MPVAGSGRVTDNQGRANTQPRKDWLPSCSPASLPSTDKALFIGSALGCSALALGPQPPSLSVIVWGPPVTKPNIQSASSFC